jgi:two-component system, sensor histidine kinase and response regulator
MGLTNTNKEKHKVLIIDDDEIICDILKTLLEDTGEYSVATANSGRQGLLRVEECNPEMILLDMVMPDIGGYDVALLLSCNESTKDIPYIFVTSLIEPRANFVINKCRYFGKPVNFDDLINTIKETIKYGNPNPLRLQ